MSPSLGRVHWKERQRHGRVLPAARVSGGSLTLPNASIPEFTARGIGSAHLQTVHESHS